MSDEDDCIVLFVGEDSDDDDDDDDVDVVLIQNFDTDFTENSSDEEVLLLLTDSEDDSDIPEELPVFSHDMEDFEALNSQIVSCLAILKGGNPDSEEVESVPLCKKARLSIPEDDHMNHTAEDLFNGHRHNQIIRLQRYCQNLQELTEIINSQINRLRELVSEIRRSLETPQMPPCGDDNPSLPAERQENDAETNPGGTSLQSAASPERQQLECPESPPLPVIVCACSLQPNHESGSPETRRFYLSLFNEGDESANNDLSSAQDSLAQPTAHLPQAESSLHDNFETVRDSAINNNMNPDTALPSLCIPPNFETPGEAETSLASSTKIMHYPTLLENVRGQDTVSSDVIPPNFETPGEAETSLASSTKIMHYPTLLENVRGQDTVSSDVIPPNFETPGEAETSLASSTKIMHYPTLLENVRGQDTVSSDVIPPNFETPGEAETSLASSTKIMHYPTLLENVRGQDTVSSDVIPPNFETPGEAETSLASSTKIMHYPTLLENVRGQDTVSSDVIPPNFETPGEAETSLASSTKIMHYPTLLENVRGQDTVSSDVIPPNFETPGEAETSLASSTKIMHYPTLLENVRGQDTVSSDVIPPNFETPGEAETSLASSTKIMHYPTLLENVRGQDTVSSDVIPPNFETPGEAETSLASSTKIMHYPTLLENVRGQDTVSSDVIPPNFETPGEAETSLASSTKIMHYPTLLENVRGQDTVSSDVIPPNFETPGEAETSLASSTKIMHYPTLLENVRGQDTVSSDVIPPNFETPGEAETSLASSTKIMHYPTLLENVRGQDTVSSDVIPPNFEVAETSLENKPETMSYSMSGNDSGPSSSSVNLPPNFGVEKFILTQKPIKEETGVENSSQTVYYPALLGSITGLGTDFSSHSAPPNFEMPGQAETTMDNSYQTVGNETVVGNETIVRKETVVGNDSDPDMGSSHLSILPSVETSQENDTPVMNQPPLLEYNRDEDASYVLIPSNFESSTEMSSEAENHGSVIKIDSDQQTDSEPCFLTPGFGYLGDPRRNVTMSDTHLMAVQKKAIPRHAACYLVRILFSKEILTSTSVGISSQGCQSLDPNKIAAIREHLAAVFPNYDLSEHGEEWQACISSVNSLICNLSSRILKTVDKNGGPTKHKRDSNDERDGDDGASSFQVSQPEAISETREHGNSPQNSRAFPEGIQEPSTDGTAVSSETLEYLGDPRRNIQMPKPLLMTAKEKSRPDLSARYLILSLFTEEVLINSVHGSTEFGVYSLNANKINALREFLQEIYPTCDLSENGYDWKLCVMAINSCIYSLRCNLEWPTYEIQLLPPTAPSTESKPKDPDLAD
ncbi:BEN domain-containing protein 2 isoform X2 [Bos indicus]|uniref:BEN domain-containing protein 2 isoform X2 n=1 Tax=Bos indicus TaxID=9915 RepID=A0ABM4RVX9_BOSIN